MSAYPARVAGCLFVIIACCLAGCTPDPIGSTPVGADTASQSPRTVSGSPQKNRSVGAVDPATVGEENSSVESDKKSSAESHHGASFYTVDHYDALRDPAADLEETIARASAENKRIIIQVGGDWCGWCHRMSKFMETNDTIRKLIEDHFLVMKVTFNTEQQNTAFLSQYPDVAAYPHLFILESDGSLLHSQGTAVLEEGQGYNEDVFRKFLEKWSTAI